MIVGIGCDICLVERIEHSLHRFGPSYVAHLFTAGEQATCEISPTRAACYAARFAAKEASAKALGTGLAGGIVWRDIEVVLSTISRPTLRFSNAALDRLNALVPAGYEAVIHLSISHRRTIVQAFVVIETLAAVAPDA